LRHRPRSAPQLEAVEPTPTHPRRNRLLTYLALEHLQLLAVCALDDDFVTLPL
jgi:hypothetical protein